MILCLVSLLQTISRTQVNLIWKWVPDSYESPGPEDSTSHKAKPSPKTPKKQKSTPSP